MKHMHLGIALAAFTQMVVSTACVGQGLSTAETDQSLRAERVEDPFVNLPVVSVSQAATTSSAKANGHSATIPAMASQADAPDASMFLFDIPFRFDRFTLLLDAQAMVEVNAMRLKESDEYRWALLLEGRCDEVGSRDYNLVLGERRAQTVREYLVNLGIPSASLDIISYGKDRPVCKDHNEACWTKNRTVHFLVK